MFEVNRIQYLCRSYSPLIVNLSENFNNVTRKIAQQVKEENIRVMAYSIYVTTLCLSESF